MCGKVLLPLASFLVIHLLLMQQGFAMTFFAKEQEVVVASPLSGVITKDSTPLRNAKLFRRLDWGEGEVVDEIYTSNDGFFEFGERRERIKTSPLSELVISQRITYLDGHGEVLIWLKSKRDPELHGELGGVPKNFRCELSDELRRVELTRGTFATLCRWDSIE
jgi:hypothetical protein